MKTGLRALTFTAFLLISISTISYSQCEVSNIVVQNIRPVSQTGSSCTVKFDVSFDIQNNNGNKYIFFHAWLQQDYPNYFHCVNGQTTLPGAIQAPTASDLGNEFLNVGINNNVDPPTIITTYPPDPSVPLNTVETITRIEHTDGSATFVLTGITTTVPVPCGTPVVIIADLWSSQSAHAQVAHCVSCGHAYSSGFLSYAGLANCSTKMFNVTVTNHTATDVTADYTVHADVNGDGVYTPSIDTTIYGPATFSISAGPGTTTTLSGPIPTANAGQDLFLVSTITSGTANGAAHVTLIPSTVCGALPVDFASFRATRVNSNSVSLRWQTASESNNTGFAIYRAEGSDWIYVTFVPTLAMGGNSSSLLTYTYTDLNNYKGISQYRIKQVDIDGKAKYSDIRVVRGEASDKILVYPNPTMDGRVTIVFEDKDGLRDLSLTDNSGRTVRQWNGISGNSMQIDNLQPGMYTIRIIMRETGLQKVEKIVVVRK